MEESCSFSPVLFLVGLFSPGIFFLYCTLLLDYLSDFGPLLQISYLCMELGVGFCNSIIRTFAVIYSTESINPRV